MSKQILLDNAYEAWMNATTYAWLIKDGISTLGYKKAFVSSLHNSVELFVKQMLLDKCDYRVATIKNGLSSDGEPLKSFYNSKDLNDYFKKLKPEILKKFFSIEFSQLIDICTNENLLGFDAGEGLNLLNRLRNDETHFYIDNSYLTEQDFKKLFNFMVDFFNTLENKKLMPWSFGPCGAKAADLLFREEKLKSFCFSSAIKRSEVTDLISDYIYKKGYDGGPTYDPLTFTWNIWDGIKRYPRIYSFERAAAYVESLFNANAISYTEEMVEIEPGGDLLPLYKVRIKRLKKKK